MYKNPLKKYRQGGSAPSEEQKQFMAAFVQWLPTRVKEFEGAQPEQIVQALNEMSNSQEGQKQVQSWMQQFQQEMQGGASMFANGGKLHDFICKHARGGYIQGCGCGSKVPKDQGGNVIGEAQEIYYNENGVPVELNRYTTRPGRMQYVEVPTKRGKNNYIWNELNKAVPGGSDFPIEYSVMTKSWLDDGSSSDHPLPLYLYNDFQKTKDSGSQKKACGGKVKKTKK